MEDPGPDSSGPPSSGTLGTPESSGSRCSRSCSEPPLSRGSPYDSSDSKVSSDSRCSSGTSDSRRLSGSASSTESSQCPTPGALEVPDDKRRRRRSVDSRASRCSVNSTKLKSLKQLADKAVEVGTLNLEFIRLLNLFVSTSVLLTLCHTMLITYLTMCYKLCV